MTGIETTDLTKRYDETLAVDGLNLSISEGVVYGFLGPNGAGKTTTMRMLTGLTRPTSGTGAVAGRVVDDPIVKLYFGGLLGVIGVLLSIAGWRGV